MTDARHVLYRMRDRAGALLYVGITMNPMARFANHRLKKHWFDEVARIDVEHHASHAELIAAEERAIRTELPRFNLQHNETVTGKPIPVQRAESPDTMKLRNVRMPDELWRDLKILAEINGVTVADLVRSVLEDAVRQNRKVIEEYRASHASTTASDGT